MSDVDGNPIALDAVLGDVETRGGADGYWVLGDLVAQGYDPAAVLRRLTALPDARFVRGNTNRYTLTGERDWPSLAEAQSDPDLVPMLVSVAQGFAWTHGYLSATGWIDWLAALPVEQRTTLPDGTRNSPLLAGGSGGSIHAAPGQDDGPGIEPDTDEEELQSLVDGCNADLVCVGHTHRPLDRRLGSVHIVNVGNVSNPAGLHPTRGPRTRCLRRTRVGTNLPSTACPTMRRRSLGPSGSTTCFPTPNGSPTASAARCPSLSPLLPTVTSHHQ